MSENGRLSDSELAAIPGGRLAREAAANWLAMRRKGGQELGIWIAPIGPRGSYRTYDEQVYFWRLYQSGKGNLAARPGTSNHGLGHAVDLAAPASMRPVVDRFGATYGWRWGEAPSENWHVTYYGGGKAAAAELTNVDHRSLGVGDDRRRRQEDPDLAPRSTAPRCKADGAFGEQTLAAVKDMYRA